ncbi:hypothetical protein BABINDRAFT_162378 [Babjeviella inositovora NRRL Y-12698]|uniref:DNA replication complex GINS protein PSF1 n=1 Tax=Babjeviella inositovora NRRL Y-12698 TaxID=984486 RepID=A0A1E3QLW1_9ASCO|nr:uncharacterized protein BABINDRAFT_162378 [Babjeviella inositovora NRRL Y-12698]ODQ78675.1 hypothetical protein BABINDRAFT_162378 [Babjeviella inositovora NRRL Y-12698]
MYGDAADKLVADAKRSTQLTHLPLYQGELIQNIINETNDLQAEVEHLTNEEIVSQTQSQGDRTNQCQLFISHLAMRRNKRCLLAYQRYRAERLQYMSWLNNTTGITVDEPGAAPSGKAADSLNHNEEEYLKKYNELIINYNKEFNESLDLTGDIEPPKDIFIDVRVLKDVGEITTEYGVFNLTKDSQFFVRYNDVARLIQQGYLQRL